MTATKVPTTPAASTTASSADTSHSPDWPRWMHEALAYGRPNSKSSAFAFDLKFPRSECRADIGSTGGDHFEFSSFFSRELSFLNGKIDNERVQGLTEFRRVFGHVRKEVL